MQVFKYDFLPPGRAILLSYVAQYMKSTAYIVIGKYNNWDEETEPPRVTNESAQEELIIYKKPRIISLATNTICKGILCDPEIVDGEEYFLIDPNDPNVELSNATHIYVEGEIRLEDYLCAYFRTTSIFVGATPPNNIDILFKPEDMIDKGAPFLSINHTRVPRLSNEVYVIKQLIKL